MNDQFLHRLRESPQLGFATKLKAKLDLHGAAAATRRRFLYLMSTLVIGGTALAFVSPSIRQLIGSAFKDFDASSAQSSLQHSQTDDSATTPLDTDPHVTTLIENRIVTPQFKNIERSSTTSAAPLALEIRQATSSSPNSNSTLRSALASDTNKLAPSLDADIAALPLGRRVSVVSVDGSSATFPIVEAVSEEFQIQANGKVRVTVGIAGTGGGLKKLCRGQVDIVGATRSILKSEMEDCAAAGIKYIELPIAYDAMAVIVNGNATWISEITAAELKSMWEPAAQSRVLRWNEINAAWPNQYLHLFGPDADSSLFDYFTDAIVGKTKATRSDYTASDTPNSVIYNVIQNYGSVGYVSYAYYAAHATQVKALQIVNREGQAVSPSESSIIDASYNPLSRLLLIYVNAGRAKRQEVSAFVRFLLTRGVRVIAKENYVPLSADTYQSALTRFQNGKAGTVFDGTSAVGVQIDEALARIPALRAK